MAFLLSVTGLGLAIAHAIGSGSHRTNDPPPHIVMVLGDDIGWGSVGWNRVKPSEEVQTPNMDRLVAEGMELTQFYTFKYCAPSRSAFQSGRNPIHVTVVNGQTTLVNQADPVSGYTGIPVNMTTIAEKLHSVGYRTHAVGKWDTGIATFKHTPAGRGYESWLGYYGHCNDYWNMIDECGMGSCPLPHSNKEVAMVDLWEQSASGAISRPASDHNNSQTCTQANQGAGCIFEDDILHTQVTDVINSHAATELKSDTPSPLFLFWASHACHGPLEVPQSTLDKFGFINLMQRQKYSSLIFYLDSMIGTTVNQLKQLDMWDNTLFAFSSDNGGDPSGNNYPLRGGKFSNWQGGIHVAAFVSGGVLPPSRRGIKLNGMATLWDMYATFGVVAGLSPQAAVADPVAAKASLPPVDSISQAEYWFGTNTTEPRHELAVGTAYGNPHGGGDSFYATSIEGLIQDGMKLILTAPGWPIDHAIWTGPQFPNTTTNSSCWLAAVDCSTGCLFNLTSDPTEHYDIAKSNPAIVAKMTARIKEINTTSFSPYRGINSLAACQVALDKYHGFWGPFVGMNVSVPTCETEMSKLCPLNSFDSYGPCRSCLKHIETTDPSKLDLCKPAAPDQFKEYCCSKFKSTDPSVNCSFSTSYY